LQTSAQSSAQGSATGSLTVESARQILDDTSANLDKDPPGNGRFENGTLTIGGTMFSMAISPITANGSNRVVFPASSIAGLPFSAVDNDTLTPPETIAGTITDVVKTGINYAWSLNVTSSSENPIDWPDFVGGTLSVSGGDNVAIIAASASAPQLTTSALNIPCSVHDDDDDNLLPKAPDVSMMAGAFAQAYVVPAYDVGDNNMNVPFVLNVADSDSAITAAMDWDSRSLNSSDYWVTYVLEAFQNALDQDADPDSEDGYVGITSLADGGSLVFLELHYESFGNPVIEEQVTVVHECGHAVGNSGSHPVTSPNSAGAFVAEYLMLIRDSPHPAP